MLRVAAGDDGAFNYLYDTQAGLLFSVIFQVLRDPKEAEDVLQEAFVQIWRRAGKFDVTRGSLSTWAAMIARHKAIDRLRSRSRFSVAMQAVALENDLGLGQSRDTTPDQHSLDREECDEVQRAVQGMDRLQREAILLAFFSGLTHVEIAAHLRTPLGTVKARIRRGLVSLRTALLEARSAPEEGPQSQTLETQSNELANLSPFVIALG